MPVNHPAFGPDAHFFRRTYSLCRQLFDLRLPVLPESSRQYD